MATRFPQITKPEIKEIFDSIDVNHDKRVSYGICLVGTQLTASKMNSRILLKTILSTQKLQKR